MSTATDRLTTIRGRYLREHARLTNIQRDLGDFSGLMPDERDRLVVERQTLTHLLATLQADIDALTEQALALPKPTRTIAQVISYTAMAQLVGHEDLTDVLDEMPDAVRRKAQKVIEQVVLKYLPAASAPYVRATESKPQYKD